MRIEWDAALVAATAAALDRRFSGARIRAVEMDVDSRRLALYLREAVLVWELHPERAGFRILEAMDPSPEARPLPARLESVWAPPDERIMVIDTRRVRGRPARGRIVLEFLPTRENIVVTEGEEATIRALLRTRESGRPLRRGKPYAFPPPSTRFGATGEPVEDGWEAVAGSATPSRSDLVRSVAWTSPLVGDALLGEDGPALWRRLRARITDPDSADGPAAVVAGRFGPQPYPVPLPDRTLIETSGLLEAFAEADRLAQASPGALLPGALLDALDDAVERERGRVARLEEEFDGLGDAEGMKALGDLLLARFHEVPDGASAVELDGFAGERVRIDLDPTLTVDANARRLYDRAAKARRARAELPERIRAAREQWRALEELAERARLGDAARAEIEAALPDHPAPGARGGPAVRSLPYRTYRSSGGLEIRVGRGAARNDELTFRHSRPNDVWLHARHAAGAHVVLRWDGEGAPPARDLEEAAVLAALHSRARTSGSVPVDWTRRKYVRKARRAPPGTVLPDRVKTVFVEPDPALEDRLRSD